MSALLRTDQVSKSFDRLQAVTEVSLELHPGETLGIVGESGCGKSTLARLMVGLLTPTAGNLYYRDRPLRDWLAQEPLALRREIQFVFQDPASALNPRKTVRQLLEDPLKVLLDLDRSQRQARVAELMEQVNLRPEFVERYPHEFSGGQAQRIGIARALAANPQLVILDEPVSALDVSVQAQILNLLRHLKQELDLSYAFISHDLAVVEHLSDRVAVMYLGRVVEWATREVLFQDPKHPYTRVLLASVPMPTQPISRHYSLHGEPPDPADPPPGCPFAPRCYRAENRCHRERPPLDSLADGRRVACFYAEDSDRPGEAVLGHTPEVAIKHHADVTDQQPPRR